MPRWRAADGGCHIRDTSYALFAAFDATMPLPPFLRADTLYYAYDAAAIDSATSATPALLRRRYYAIAAAAFLIRHELRLRALRRRLLLPII